MLRQVLIIDDDEYDRLALTRALGAFSEPIELTHATSGAHALSLLEQSQFDALIIDYQLHDMTADDLVGHIVQSGDRSVAMVVVAGQGDIRHVTKIMQKGAHDYLIKDDLTPQRIERALTTAWRTVTMDNALERQRLELLRSNAELEQYAVLASHDLRQPLRSITGFLELLEERTKGVLDDETSTYLKHAIEGADQMRGYVQGLLEVARLKNSPEELGFFDSGAVLQSVIAILKGTIGQHSARIRISGSPELIGERQHFLQVTQNLVSNALLYGKPETAVDIVIEANYQTTLPPHTLPNLAERTGLWRWTVSDNGRGIPPEQRARIFRMFQKVEPAEQDQGSGIGLAICRKLIAASGGKIWLDDDFSDGCRFHFTWPGQLIENV
ncbi:MAG: ATP-binding protein [Woeseiaceae bacterium]